MKKVISDIKISRSGKQKTCTISLEGELTVNNVAGIKGELIHVLEKCDSLQLRIQNVTSTDLSWIQLLQSLRKTCNNSDKNIAISMILNSDVELLLTRAGFGSLLESAKPNNQTIC